MLVLPVGQSDRGIADAAERLRLDWWPALTLAAQWQWFELCQVLSNASAAYIRAAWHEGTVYWFSNGLAVPQPQAAACKPDAPDIAHRIELH